ncbi:MAG: hypothetical protein DLM67_12520 [Candidatus Nephthysia bennettiae]|nr:MAG: hypothetical protein DLM67_12520 [Candidatus Dormibacteraeota bacterium]
MQLRHRVGQAYGGQHEDGQDGVQETQAESGHHDRDQEGVHRGEAREVVETQRQDCQHGSHRHGDGC